MTSTPVEWRPGEDVVIAGSVSSEVAEQIFGTWDSPKPYIRVVPDPSACERQRPRRIHWIATSGAHTIRAMTGTNSMPNRSATATTTPNT